MDKIDDIITSINIDFDNSVKQQLISVFHEVENIDVPVVEDDYVIKTKLKDDSIFAFLPRRFTHKERFQIREITDDLLSRHIIKESNSPYCARVPVRKKNGAIRLGVNLRPLNNRTIKQKYPFPIIKDCLARLSDKNVFTLFDLKDEFHQIKIHLNHTKFFSFATPDDQFEFLRLPFCEAPVELQKRLVSIL